MFVIMVLKESQVNYLLDVKISQFRFELGRFDGELKRAVTNRLTEQWQKNKWPYQL